MVSMPSKIEWRAELRYFSARFRRAKIIFGNKNQRVQSSGFVALRSKSNARHHLGKILFYQNSTHSHQGSKHVACTLARRLLVGNCTTCYIRTILKKILYYAGHLYRYPRQNHNAVFHLSLLLLCEIKQLLVTMWRLWKGTCFIFHINYLHIFNQ
jgi:hypothetical protein